MLTNSNVHFELTVNQLVSGALNVNWWDGSGLHVQMIIWRTEAKHEGRRHLSAEFGGDKTVCNMI